MSYCLTLCTQSCPVSFFLPRCKAKHYPYTFSFVWQHQILLINQITNTLQTPLLEMVTYHCHLCHITSNSGGCLASLCSHSIHLACETSNKSTYWMHSYKQMKFKFIFLLVRVFIWGFSILVPITRVIINNQYCWTFKAHLSPLTRIILSFCSPSHEIPCHCVLVFHMASLTAPCCFYGPVSLAT